MEYDPTINLGTIVAMVGIMLSVFAASAAFYTRLGAALQRVVRVEEKLGRIEHTQEQHGTALVDIKVQAAMLADGNERMNRLERRLESLETNR